MGNSLLTKDNVVIGLLILLVANYMGYFGTPAGTPAGDGTSIVVPPEDVTVTLSGIDKYQTGTSRTTAYAKVYIQDSGQWFDQGLISLNSGTFEADASTPVKMYGAENSTTYYTEKKAVTLPAAKGQPKYQFELITIDTSPTLTFYNDDGDSNTAQAMAASSTKQVSIRYEATTYKGLGNPQCVDNGKPAVTICLEYNTSAFTSVDMPELTIAPIPTKIAAWGNASFGYKCFGAAGVYNGGDQRYKVKVTSSAKEPVADVGCYINVWYEDCDFDIHARTSAEIWDTQDEENNDLGSTTEIVDIITFS